MLQLDTRKVALKAVLQCLDPLHDRVILEDVTQLYLLLVHFSKLY